MACPATQLAKLWVGISLLTPLPPAPAESVDIPNRVCAHLSRTNLEPPLIVSQICYSIVSQRGPMGTIFLREYL